MLRPSKRRGLRFSLRTMFILWTAVAVWLGWNVHVVHQRQALRKELTARGDAVFYRRDAGVKDLRTIKAQERRMMAAALFSVDDRYRRSMGTTIYLPAYEPLPAADDGVSWLRGWIGDQAIVTISLEEPYELERVRRLFPEALIRVRKVRKVRPPAYFQTLPDSQPQATRPPLA